MLSGDRDSAHLDWSLVERTTKRHRSVGKKLSAHDIRRLAEEVIQRLAARAPDPEPDSSELSEEKLNSLCTALIGEDDKTCLEMVRALQKEHALHSGAYFDHLAAAARRLGEWWVDDKASFADVTIGAGRIYAILRALRPVLVEYSTVHIRRAVFATVPGEEHFLGVTMASDLFRSRGWDITLWNGRAHDHLLAGLEESDVPFIGLTASGKLSVMPLIRMIVALRVARPDAFILVSGNVTSENSDLLDVSGADFIAHDIEAAFAEMERMIGKS